MLVDMATQPLSVDFEQPAILDYQLPLALGVALAGSAAACCTKTIKG